MAKHLVKKYTFVPTLDTVVIGQHVAHARLLLITNVTRGVVIYNFADEQLSGTTTYDDATESTSVVLVKDCAAMSATDVLQIFIEQDFVSMEPSETFVDPVSKFRVSTPQNLVDTDFEYGPQSSKWETLQLINSIPAFFSSTADTTIPFILSLTSTINSEIITVTTDFEHNLSSGTPITVTGLSSVTAEGTYLIQSVPTTKSFTYKARAKQTSSRELQGTYTSVIPGQFFQGSQITVDEASGIVSDTFTKVVTVKSVKTLTFTDAPHYTWEVGAVISSTGGATGVITKISGVTVTITESSVTGFVDGDVVSATGSSFTKTIDVLGVSAPSNVYFIDGEQTPSLALSRKAIYIFDVSDPSIDTHPFKIGEAAEGSEYSTFVYTSGTAGQQNAYVRIYVTNSTVASLFYFCSTHTGMGGILTPTSVTESKIYLTTANEHGFADNTNFYFVNSIAPKILDVIDPTATATDGRPFVDTAQVATVIASPEPKETIPYNNESTYTVRFDEAAVDLATNRITITSHGFNNGYAVLYYPAPGDTPIGSLNRMLVYYVEKIDDNTIRLHDSQRINTLKDLTTGGTFNFGKHTLGLVYNCYREYKSYGDYNAYFYTYYWNWGGTYSGHDFAAVNGTYGLGGVAWDSVAFFSVSRPGYGGHNQYLYNYTWYYNFGTYWRTYGYHMQTLPLGTSAIYQGSYDFITDNNNYGINGDNNGGNSRGYTVGGYGQVNGRTYWTSTFWGVDMNSSRLRLYGNEGYYWAYQGDTDGWWASQNGYTRANDRYFGDVSSDGNTNMYYVLLKRNTATNDSFYKQDHSLDTNDVVTLTVNSGSGISYWNDLAGSTATLTSGNVTVERIDSTRFRIKPNSGSSPYRLAAADGTYTFSIVKINPFKNSIFIKDNQFSNDELILYTLDITASEIGGLSNNSSFYLKALNNNRFQLGTAPGFTTEITLTTSGTGIQTFENASATFGAVDGSYTTTRAISENSLEITLPFKLSPGNKPFAADTAVTTGASGYITIPNHFFSSGTRVIYNAASGTPVGGLTTNYDYYVIVLDDARIRLALTLADAVAGNSVTLSSTGTGTQSLITSNLSGLITGAGTADVVSGTGIAARTILGTNTNFKRYFKVGDTIRVINSATTPGTIVSKQITAIKDDGSLLVDIPFDFDGTGLKYFIPTYIYVRPDGYFLHRPFDGGMEMGTSNSPDGLICRQTRKYFRYQSGKGIQTSFAINFVPQNAINSLSYTPQGTQTTLTVSGVAGENRLTVENGDTTAGLVAYMEIDGLSVGVTLNDSCQVKSILNSTTIILDNPLLQSVTSVVIQLKQAELATIISSRPHNTKEGTEVAIVNSDVAYFNATFNTTEVVNDFTFRVQLKNVPSGIGSSGGFPSFSVNKWQGSAVRAGMFDFQNGFFFEYDGENVACVRRSSVQQLTGTVSVTKGSGVVDGTNTMFPTQLAKGDMIVIRGMSHKVVKVRNTNQIVIQPAYKGVTNTNVVCTKTIDVKVSQPNWNIDTCDGNGPSGYVLKVGRIQMCYADYSWYGAGKIRFGFKDQNGHVMYAHAFKHNNKLLESYFRSGNLPARYEIENTGTPSFVPSLFHWGTSVIMDGMFQDDEAYLFTASGSVLKYTNATTSTQTTNNNSIVLEERVNNWNSRYFIRIPFPSSAQTSLTVNTLIYNNSVANGYFVAGRNIDTRSYVSGSIYYVYIQYVDGNTSIFPRFFTNTINSRLNNPAAPSSTVFNVGSPAGSENRIPSYIPLLSIRLAPSVDSSITGGIGQREIINRMQLNLQSVGVQVTHESEISMILNAELSTDLFENVASPSLCQLVKHTPNETLSGGQRILSFRASGGSIEGSRRLSESTIYDLAELSALGNSILGGDGVFPNGPDLLTIVSEVIDSTGISTSSPYSATSRITWKESQA